eukprot:COSAG06_NODE_28154_length_579_cov_2.339583_1_plen_34_part_10
MPQVAIARLEDARLVGQTAQNRSRRCETNTCACS